MNFGDNGLDINLFVLLQLSDFCFQATPPWLEPGNVALLGRTVAAMGFS